MNVGLAMWRLLFRISKGTEKRKPRYCTVSGKMIALLAKKTTST